MTTNNNRYFAIMFSAGGLVVILAIVVFLLTGCNAEKRAVKKSDKHFFKAVAWDKGNVHGRCSDIAPPIVMTKDSFIYKPGKTIPSSKPEYVYVDCDSVLKSQGGSEIRPPSKVKIPCPPCDSVRVDTFYVSVRNTEVDRNKEMSQAAIIKEQDKKIASQSTTINYLWILVAILGAYTLARWAFSYFTKGRVRLP